MLKLKNCTLFLAVILFFLFASCEKDFRFKGITTTNALGEQLGDDKDDDWGLDDDWGKSVHQLFDHTFLSSGDCGYSVKAAENSTDSIDEVISILALSVVPAYPNPARSMTTFSVSFAEPGTLRIILVDEKQEVYLSECRELGLSSMNLSLNLSDIDDRGELYRLFYHFKGEENEYFGHGDILVE